MIQENTFGVSRFENRNGVFSWRVDGRLHGIRIRRNFKTQEEAAAEKAALELKALQTTSGLQSVITFLAADQFREAESVFRRLAGRPRPLSFYVEFALANYREPETQKLLTEAVTAYVATKQHEHEQDLLSEPHLTRMKRDLKRLEKHFPGATVAELTGARLVEYFEARNAALKTYNNRRGIVSTFLKFAQQRDWVTDNPLDKIPQRRIRRRRGGAVTFTAQQAKDLMAFVEEHYASAVPFFALCLFAGIRPGRRQVGTDHAGDIPPGDYIWWKVADSGKGIDPSEANRIFDPYFTAKDRPEAAGLGLTEVWGIIRGHDGFISFESVVGQGSSFEIHFPLARATPTAAPAGSRVILVLDHEDEIRQVIAEQLSARGKTVLLATNSAEGLALLAEHQNKIAVVIVNLDLPTDAGINLTQVLPRLAPAAKIILTYKQPPAESFESYKSRQVVAVISRENAPKDLAASIAKII